MFDWGHSKKTFARNFQCSSLFVLHVLPSPSTLRLLLWVTHPPAPLFLSLSQKKFFDAYEFSNEKSESEKREKIFFFCKLNVNDQYSLHSYIYNDNKNIYKFIKKR